MSDNKLEDWYAFDLDRTLATYESGDYEKYGAEYIGEPILPMVNLVKQFLAEGKVVKIFTARLAHDNSGTTLQIIQDWSEKHIGVRLPVTNVKDFAMIALYDDRAVQVIPNHGIRLESVLDETIGYLQYMINTYAPVDNDGYFTFPDGTVFRKSN